MRIDYSHLFSLKTLKENMAGMSTYVGGDSSSLDISEVVNTNLQSGDSQSEAVIAGKGVGSSQGSEKFEARDWGVLMCIYHNVPLLDYVSSAPDPRYRDWETDRKSTRLNSSHRSLSRMPSSA